MNASKLGADGKLVLHAIVNVAGNGAIVGLLPTILPTWAVAIAFLAFNLAQVILAYLDPTYTVHLIETGQMAAPQQPAAKAPSEPQA